MAADPVNATLSALPTGFPYPDTRSTVPAGNPASLINSHTLRADNGVASAHFGDDSIACRQSWRNLPDKHHQWEAVLLRPSRKALMWDTCFQGMICPHIPTGSRLVYSKVPGMLKLA